MNEKVQKAKVLTTMFACFGQANDGVRIASYVQMLDDIPADVLSVVCKKATLESKFLPTIAELIESARSIAGSVNESNRVKSWDEAWQEIQTQIDRVFIYEKPVFSRPEIEMAVKRYGWADLCTTPAKDWRTAHAQLREIYKTICERKKEDSVNGYLLGNNHLIGTIKQIEG